MLVAAEKLITPDSFARTFCDDLELGPEQAAEVSRQIAEQIDEQAGMAEVPFRSAEEEEEMIEKDLRVIINVSHGSLLLAVAPSRAHETYLTIARRSNRNPSSPRSYRMGSNLFTHPRTLRFDPRPRSLAPHFCRTRHLSRTARRTVPTEEILSRDGSDRGGRLAVEEERVETFRRDLEGVDGGSEFRTVGVEVNA